MRVVVATSADDPLAGEFWNAYHRAGGPPLSAVVVLEGRSRTPAWRRAAEGLLLFGLRAGGRAWAMGRRTRGLIRQDPEMIFGDVGAFHRVPSLNRGDGLAVLQRLAPDLLVSAGSPEVFKPHVLRLAAVGAVNVHNGRLPAYRGLFGTFWEALNEEEWGYACIHVMHPEVDTGPVLARAPVRLAGQALWDVLVAKKRLGGTLLAWLVQYAKEHGRLPSPCPYDADLAPGYYSWPSLRDIGRLWLKRRFCKFQQATLGREPAGAWPVPDRPRVRLAHLTTVDLSLRFLLRDQLRAFAEAGYDVVAMSAPGPWVADLEADGVRHVAIPSLHRRWAPMADLVAFISLVRALGQCRPTIVHTHTPKARILGRLAARAAGVPIVVNTYHGLYGVEGGRLRRRLFLLLERAAARWSDFEFSQSLEDLQTLRSARVADPDRSAFLGNGVNLRQFDPDRLDRGGIRQRLGIGQQQVVVGTVGRLVWEKGYREFFAMAEALKRLEPGVVTLVVGPHEPGKRDAVPLAIVQDLERRGLVRFLGMRTDMADLYAAMDVFVLASYREGFPRAAVEAAAMGLPLVLTDIRGCREVATDGRNGFLVPVRDPARLVEAVRRLVQDQALRVRFGQESRRRALAEFDERRVIATTFDVYRRLLEEKQGLSAPALQQSGVR